MPKVKIEHIGPRPPRLTAQQVGYGFTVGTLVAALTCNNGLPKEFRSFLRKHNGGCPRPAHFVHRYADGSKLIAHVDSLWGIDPRAFDHPRRTHDCISATLGRREMLPLFSIPIGSVDRDDLLLLFYDGKRKGQVWLQSDSAVQDLMCVDPKRGLPRFEPESTIDFVAKTFDKFLGLLYEATEEEIERSLSQHIG